MTVLSASRTETKAHPLVGKVAAKNEGEAQFRYELTRVRENAYCPYSGYPVGAALLDSAGNVHVGCNMENASSGLTVCAERNAVAAMVAAGGRGIVELAVVTSNGAAPCGACLQVISEHAARPDIPIRVSSDGPEPTVRVLSLSDLLPEPFRRSS